MVSNKQVERMAARIGLLLKIAHWATGNEIAGLKKAGYRNVELKLCDGDPRNYFEAEGLCSALTMLNVGYSWTRTPEGELYSFNVKLPETGEIKRYALQHQFEKDSDLEG